MEKNKALPFVIEKSEADSSHVIANRKWGQSPFFKMKIPHMSLRTAKGQSPNTYSERTFFNSFFKKGIT